MTGSVAENGVHIRGIFRRAVNGKVRLDRSGKSSAVHAVRAADTVLSEEAVAETQCKGKTLLAYIFLLLQTLLLLEGQSFHKNPKMLNHFLQRYPRIYFPFLQIPAPYIPWSKVPCF